MTVNITYIPVEHYILQLTILSELCEEKEVGGEKGQTWRKDRQESFPTSSLSETDACMLICCVCLSQVLPALQHFSNLCLTFSLLFVKSNDLCIGKKTKQNAHTHKCIFEFLNTEKMCSKRGNYLSTKPCFTHCLCFLASWLTAFLNFLKGSNFKAGPFMSMNGAKENLNALR